MNLFCKFLKRYQAGGDIVTNWMNDVADQLESMSKTIPASVNGPAALKMAADLFRRDVMTDGGKLEGQENSK